MKQFSYLIVVMRCLIILFFCAFCCMGDNPPVKQQFQLLLRQSELGGLSPRMQENISKDEEVWTGSIVENKGRLNDYLKDFICLADINRHTRFFYKTKLSFQNIEELLKSKKNINIYIDQFGPFGRRPDYIADVLRHTWNLALMNNEKEIVELVIIEGYFNPIGTVNGKINFQLSGFRIFCSKSILKNK